MHAGRRDTVKDTLFGVSPAPHAGSPAKQRQQEYAAELREQIAAKEAARQLERAHSLRQSAALLELRRAAPSAVLPVVGPARQQQQQAEDSWGSQVQASSWSPLHPPQQQHQQHAPSGWASGEHRMEMQGEHRMEMQGHEQTLAPSAPPLVPGPTESGWADVSAGAWQGSPAGHRAQQQHQLEGMPQVGLPALPQHLPPPGLPPPGLRGRGSLVQPPFRVEHGQPMHAEPPPPWEPAVARAPFGNDLQQPAQQLARSPSQRAPSFSMENSVSAGAGALLGLVMPPRAVAGVGAAEEHGAGGSSGGMLPPVRGAGPGRLAALGGGGVDDKVAARHAIDAKRAAYKADLERQIREKQERRRQEQAAERVSEARQAAEAEQLLQRAAAGRYGGGSGPLRDADGRPITDLNQVRRYQEAPSNQASPESRRSLHAPGGPSTIPAHWGQEQALPPVGAGGWQDGGSTAMPPPYPQQQPRMRRPSGMSDWNQQAAHPLPPQHYQQQYSGGPPPPMRRPSGAPSYGQHPLSTMQHPSGGAASEWPQPPPGEESGWLDPGQQHMTDQAPAPPAGGWPPNASHGNPATGAGAAPPRGSLLVPAPGGGTDVMRVRLRSDRPYQTASEAERKAKAQADFQAALRAQMEEKARIKADEQRRRMEEEAAEEARLAREQERMRQQFDADQAKQRTKKAAKEAGGAQTMESGGISIKFKPPPAGRKAQQVQEEEPQQGPRARLAERQQQQQQHQGRDAELEAGPRGSRGDGMVGPDDALPGIEIRVRGPPPPRAPAQHEDPPMHEEQQPQQLPLPSLPPQHQQQALQRTPSGAWQPPTNGQQAGGGQATEPTSAQPSNQQQDPMPAGGASGAPVGGPAPWQPAPQGMQAGLPPLPPAQMVPPAGLPWQQPWVPYGPAVPPGAAPVPPGWAAPQGLPLQAQQPLPPHFMAPLHLQPLPSLAGPAGPPPAQSQWGPPVPQLPPAYGPPMAASQPQWAAQPDGAAPWGPGGAGASSGPPWMPQPAPPRYAPSPGASSAPSNPLTQVPMQPPRQGQQQQAWAHPHLRASMNLVASPADGVPYRQGGMPVYETRGVLSAYESVTTSRPPSALGTGLLRQGTASTQSHGRPSTLGGLVVGQESSAVSSQPLRSTMAFPPQPPLTVMSGQAELFEQQAGQGGSRRGSRADRCSSGRSSHAAQGGSGRGSHAGQGGSGRGSQTGSVPLEEAAGAPGEGLAAWGQLSPISRPSSSAIPLHHQQQRHDQAGSVQGAGSSRRHSSWGGMFGAQASADAPAAGHWPS